MLQRSLIACLVLLTAAALHSVDSSFAVSTVQDPAHGRAVPGLRVAVNPATGEIVAQPTADHLGRPAPPVRGPRRGADELETFDLPSGARGVVLDGWAHHETRVERGADGAWRTVCSQGDRHGEVR